MRITGISPCGNRNAYANYNQRHNESKNVSFGKFADVNAEKSVRDIYVAEMNKHQYGQYAYRLKFDTIKRCPFAEVYTDEADDDKIKVRFDEEILKSKKCKRDLVAITKRESEGDSSLDTYNKLESLRRRIAQITGELLPGEEFEPLPEELVDGAEQAWERRNQENIEYLAYW